MKDKKVLEKEQAKEKALRLLEFRSHSEKELRDKLKMAGARMEDIPEIMEFLKEYNLINDYDYALRLSHDLQNLKKYGKRRIKDELYHKGISADVLDEVLAELPEDDADELLPLVEKKLGGNFEQKNIDKAMRYFAYRGYGFDDIKACVEKLKQEN